MASPTEPGDSAPRGWWRCRAMHADGTPAWLAVVPASTRFEDDVVVELPEAEAGETVGDDAVCVAHYDAAGVTAISVAAHAAPKAPPLWFAELTEPSAAPPAVSLMALSGHGVTAGTLVDRAVLGAVAVVSSDQLAAIRWYPATGELDQIYVSPQWRRRTIASALMLAAGTLSVARDWPRLWSDGQRTAMGERLRNAGPWAHRAAPLTHLAPPMTPFDQR